MIEEEEEETMPEEEVVVRAGVESARGKALPTTTTRKETAGTARGAAKGRLPTKARPPRCASRTPDTANHS